MAEEDLVMTDLLVFAVIFGVLAIMNLYRLAKGPHAADRMVAADAMDICMACAMMLFSLFSGRGIYLDIAIITAMLGIINTMLVGRYLDRGRWVYHDDEDNN
jgi:multisubunit Na+/H+ antiporter MnhF subunit